MKEIGDSSKITLEHIVKVGEYIDIIIEELNKYKKADLIDNINRMTVVDILYTLLYGQNLSTHNRLLNTIYNNSINYKYIDGDIKQVDLYKKYVAELMDRKINHDKTKLKHPEKEEFDKYYKSIGKISYGSEEYKKSLSNLKSALEHHYRYNRHHPEHFGNGIYGMSIMDLTEMICDWKAASDNQQNGDIYKGIEISSARFNYDKKMVKVLSNTVDKYFVGK